MDFFGILLCVTMVFTGAPRMATGNLSVEDIMHSPVGSKPQAGFESELPSVATLARYRAGGLGGFEDYVAWGMVEPQESRWNWTRQERVYTRLHEAGLEYIPYIWCHVPPVWLRDDPRATLMKNIATGKTCYMFSIYDPRTVDWYEHFYQALKAQFGGRIEEVYACLLGPYGEGNYPLPYVDFVLNVGDCPDGAYWCGDAYALPAFQKAMKQKYRRIAALNDAWDTTYAGFDEVTFPADVIAGKVRTSAQRPVTERRRWLDFIHWYHQALIDFSANVVNRVKEVFRGAPVATKPGGNSGWMNPVSWGTYNPGFARMAGHIGMQMQSADSRGAYWADKWTSTAYSFYGVPYRTEAAGGLDARSFAVRTFTDISCGAVRLFTYEIDTHLAAASESLPLFTGERGKTDVALLAPTTYHYLNGDVMPTVNAGMQLRDYFDYDVLDELLISDGALKRYRVLIAVGCPIVEEDILRRIKAWTRRGGVLLWAVDRDVTTVEGSGISWVNAASAEGSPCGRGRVVRTDQSEVALGQAALPLVFASDAMPRLDGIADKVWTTERAYEVLLVNMNETTIEKVVQWKGQERRVSLLPFRVVTISGVPKP